MRFIVDSCVSLRACNALRRHGHDVEWIPDAEGITRFPVAIVRLEHVEPEYRELLRSKGRVAYQRRT